MFLSNLDMNFKKGIPRDFFEYVQAATQPDESQGHSSVTLKDSPVRLSILEVVRIKLFLQMMCSGLVLLMK